MITKAKYSSEDRLKDNFLFIGPIGGVEGVKFVSTRDCNSSGLVMVT